MRYALVGAFVLCSALMWRPALAGPIGGQAIGGPEKGRPTPDKEPGITTMLVMDRPDFRVLRDWADAGATRVMHSHPGVTYHVFTLLTGQLTLTIEGKPPIEVKAGDAIDLPGGARHTFTNNGTVTATVVEVFGKAPKPAPR